MDFDALLAETEANLDAARPFRSKRERKYLQMHPPAWVFKDKDDMRVLYKDQQLLLDEGYVVWGRVVQANAYLYRPYLHLDCGATIIFCPERDGHSVETLDAIAGDLSALKPKHKLTNEHDAFDNEEEERYGHMLADEMIRAIDWYAPPSLSRGKVVRSTSIMLPRKHLPKHRLAQMTFPILVHPSTASTRLVPERYWPDELREWWERAVSSERPKNLVPNGFAGAYKKIRRGFGFFSTFPLGIAVSFLCLFMPFLAYEELSYDLGAELIELSSAAEAPNLPHDSYVGFKAKLDYVNEVTTRDDSEHTLTPVLGTDDRVIVMRQQWDLMKTPIPAEEEEVIRGRLTHRDPDTGRWSTRNRSVSLPLRFRRVKLNIPDGAVVISDHEHPEIETFDVVAWSLCLLGALIFIRRAVRTSRMLTDDEYCYLVLDRHGDIEL